MDCPSNYVACPYYCAEGQSCTLKEVKDLDPKEVCDQYTSLDSLYDKYSYIGSVYTNPTIEE